MPADLAVIGLGPLGLSLARAAVSAGVTTLGHALAVDPGQDLAEDLAGVGLTPAGQRRMLAGGFRVSTDPAALGRVRTAALCAPVPRNRHGLPDLSHVAEAGRVLAARLRPHTTVVLCSPVPPGTTENMLRPLLEEVSGLRAGIDFHLAHAPRPLDLSGPSPWSRAPQVIGALTPACTESAAAFFGRLTGKVVRARGVREAETVHLLETDRHHVNLALVNETAMLCHELGVDVWDVIRCAETRPPVLHSLRPGADAGAPGVPQALTGAHGANPLRMVELAGQINDHMPRYVVRRAAALLNEHGKSARGARILLLGVTHRPDVATQQGSPAREIADSLGELGAHVSYHDPHVFSWHVRDRPVPRADGLYEAVADSDLTVLLQPHRTYDLQGISVKAQLLLDTRGATPTGAAHRL